MTELSGTITQNGSVDVQKPICFDTLGSGTIWGSSSGVTYLGIGSGIPSLKLHSSSGQGAAAVPILEP